MHRPDRLALIILLLFSAASLAASVTWVEVKRQDGRVYIRSEIIIDAPLPEVYEALLEYDQFDEISEDFTDSRYIEPAEDGSPRIYTRIEGCIWFFCKVIERTARLELEYQKTITAIAEPELSTADLSIETWALTARDGSTVIDYRHEIEPGFWVPPLIGTLVIRRTVRSSALETAQQIEALALESLQKKTQWSSNPVSNMKFVPLDSD